MVGASATVIAAMVAGGVLVYQNTHSGADIPAPAITTSTDAVDDTPETVEETVVVVEDTPAVSEPVVEETTEVVQTEPEEVPAVAEPEPEPEPSVIAEEPLRDGPEFDTVRVDPRGDAVIAGRFDGGGVIEFLLDDVAIERAEAGADGSFVSFLTIEPSDNPRVLTMVGDPDGDRVISADSVIVSPFAAPVETVVAAAEVEPAASPVEEEASAEETDPVVEPQDEAVEVADTMVEVADEPSDEEPATPIAEATAEMSADGETETVEVETQTAAPQVLIANDEGVEVIQSGSTEATTAVALDTITYDTSGEVELAGRATSGEGTVQLYLDNEPVSTVQVDEQGDWKASLPDDVETGVYTLRVDEVTDEGEVVSRIETPFLREEPETVAASMADQVTEETRVAVRTVQPGNSLWAIARETYGDGLLYVYVFEANKADIRDPDLIYPGQVFVLPEINQ